MRLEYSSVPGDVERDKAMWFLLERAVLTTSVCRELVAAEGRYADKRVLAALDLLRSWIADRYPPEVEAHAGDGLEDMVVPDEGRSLMAEIRAGIEVCEALAMLWTADSPNDYKSDTVTLDHELRQWRATFA